MTNRKREYAIVAFIISLTIAVCSYLVYNVVDILRYKNGKPEDILYKSINDGNVDYKVYLKNNDFIDEQYIDDKYSFITDLIDHITTKFNYNFSGNESSSVDYDYFIKATIVSKSLTDGNPSAKPLWNKDFILLDHKTGSTTNGKVTITENLDIRIDQYNQMLDTFNKNLNILLESRLDIMLSINFKIASLNQPLEKEHKLTLSIPLGVKVFDMDILKNFSDEEITYKGNKSNIETSYMLAIIYITIILLVSGVAFYLVKLIINRKKGDYESKVNKLLKEYDDRIVTVDNFVRYEKLEIVDISNFEELLTFSDETLEPIIYWEKRERKNIESWFSIIRNKILFRYVIRYDNSKLDT